ncbi:MAG: LuxR family transcriptional regulator [Nitrospira sp.]|nr:LuxR family transcriptional regulator [Nitrospira sp.]
MSRLSHSQHSKLQHFLADLYTLRDHQTLITHALSACHRLIDCDIVSYNEVDLRHKHVVNKWCPDDPPLRETLLPALERTVHQHPAFPFIFRTRGARSVKVSDVAPLRAFQRLDIYQQFFKHVDTNYQLGTIVDVKPMFFVGIGFNRRHRDFATHHHTILDLLRPHFVQATHNARTVTHLGNQFSAFNMTLAQSHQGIVCTDLKGRVRFTTDEAVRLMNKYGLRVRGIPARVPSLLRSWLESCIDHLGSAKIVSNTIPPLIIEREHGSLQVRLAHYDEQLLLLLEEFSSEQSIEALLVLGLTPREAEVLRWVAQGKSNPEVGTILGISSRTVQKHLERIYCRLGVENRHAAIRVATEKASVR